MKTKPVAIAHPLKYESDLPVLPISMYVELFTCPSCKELTGPTLRCNYQSLVLRLSPHLANKISTGILLTFLVKLFCELASHSSAGAVFDDNWWYGTVSQILLLFHLRILLRLNGPWEIKHYTSDAAREDALHPDIYLV
jgi:hypothetical protein